MLNSCGLLKLGICYVDDISNPSWVLNVMRRIDWTFLGLTTRQISTILFTIKTTCFTHRSQPFAGTRCVCSFSRFIAVVVFFSSLHDYFHTIANRMCKTLPANLLTNSNSQMKNKMSMFFYLFVLFSICFIIFVTPKWHHSTNNSMDFVFINIFCPSLTCSVWMFVCVLRINFASSFWHQWFDVIPWNRLYKAGMLQQQRKKNTWHDDKKAMSTLLLYSIFGRNTNLVYALAGWEMVAKASKNMLQKKTPK